MKKLITRVSYGSDHRGSILLYKAAPYARVGEPIAPDNPDLIMKVRIENLSAADRSNFANELRDLLKKYQTQHFPIPLLSEDRESDDENS